MQVLDRTGVGTLWSICKTKFALAGHTHSSVTDGTMTIYPMANNEVNFGGSNNSATIYFGYRAKDSKPIPTSFVFGGSTGTATLTAAKFKGALEGNASTASNASRVNGHTVNSDVPSGAKFTDTNTWRGIQDNLTSTSTSESLSANQGKVLKGLIDGKANSNHTHSWSQISGAPATATRWPSWGEVTGKPELKSWSETKSYIDSKIDSENNYPCYSLQSYIQSQLKPFGLTCRTYPCNKGEYNVGAKCGILIRDEGNLVSNLFENNSLILPGFLYNATDVKICKQIEYLSGKRIHCIWNNYIVSVELSRQGSGINLDVCFYNILTDTTKKITVSDGTVDTEPINNSTVACTYDNLYVANNSSLYVFDKSLNFKRYANVIPNQAGAIQYLYNYGDLGIFIKPTYGDYAYYYKNGTISKYTGSASNVGSLKYTKNGHEYDLGSNNYQLITDDLAIRSVTTDTYIAGNTVKNLLFLIVDLQKNIEFQINIPIELFGIRITGNPEYDFNGVPIVEMIKSPYNNYVLRYYVLVYKE